jgi:hypothetical protein
MPIRRNTNALDRLTRDTPDRIDAVMAALAADLQESIIHRGISATISTTDRSRTISTDAASTEYGTLTSAAQPIVEPALFELAKRLPGLIKVAIGGIKR